MNLLQGIYFQSVPIRFVEDGHMSLTVGTVTFTCRGPGPWVTCQGREGHLVDRQHGRMLNFKWGTCMYHFHHRPTYIWWNFCIAIVTLATSQSQRLLILVFYQFKISVNENFILFWTRLMRMRILCWILKIVMSCSRRSLTAPKSWYPSEKSIVI